MGAPLKYAAELGRTHDGAGVDWPAALSALRPRQHFTSPYTIFITELAAMSPTTGFNIET